MQQPRFCCPACGFVFPNPEQLAAVLKSERNVCLPKGGANRNPWPTPIIECPECQAALLPNSDGVLRTLADDGRLDRTPR